MDDTIIKLEDCIKGRVYKIHARNFNYGVFDGEGGFIGIRLKFGDKYLFKEYHWDKGGTVKPRIDTGMDILDNIVLKERLGIDYIKNETIPNEPLFEFLTEIEKQLF